MPLMSEIHDFLCNPKHQCFVQLDLKHSYWPIPLHPDSRGYLTFTLNNKPQLQPTRLPQGSMSATFGLTQCMNIALGVLLKLPNNLKADDGSDGRAPSLLHHKEIDNEDLKFYMDGIFGAYPSFQAGFSHLQFHLLPRIAWANFRLSFKKLRLLWMKLIPWEASTKLGVLQ
ncbi:hypothetical protein K3495_g10852 [Podosphaera aphanis]|nr:hypothetical protein K3495_g10852 [Podosphaera aphanis]